jgi:hypothetical protein
MRGRQRSEEAEEMGIRALGFLAGDPERLGRFFEMTGLSPADIRAAAADPAFWPAMLEYLAADESLLLAFAAHEGLDPASIERARLKLLPPGAEGLREG